MAYMVPQYMESDSESVLRTDKHGDSRAMPDGPPCDPEEGETDEELEAGWYYRLSAPGYLDKTDWTGPYDTERDAERACYEAHDICAHCGEDLPEDIDMILCDYCLPSATFERFKLSLTSAEVCSVPITGPADDAVAALACSVGIADQLDSIGPERIIAGLAEYGAWTREELGAALPSENRQRIVWIACGDLREGYHA